MKSLNLPEHLRKYAIEQSDRKYTPVDHAVWRFIMRQLRSYLSIHAHEAYLSGLEKTGISIEHIPQISDISAKLSKFGWHALPVSGFLPPAAFMELEALNVLPIASDIRSLDHLLYTPAPDIVHEAAGHAPLIAHPEYAEYLRQYAQVAQKAILSKYDMDMYSAIRVLSDLKESPHSTPEQIAAAEKNLTTVSKTEKTVSEATWLSRMNWWTAEYGLVGKLDRPKIYGAGLLSSVGESKWCMSDKVRKIPLTIDCIHQSYDITEPQPQLFVTKNFAALSDVLEELAEMMAFRIGGLKAVQRAIDAETVNTVELNSGLQISGKCIEAIESRGELAYLRFDGPCQLSMRSVQLPGHGADYHAHGFGTPVGFLKDYSSRCPSKLSDNEWEKLGAKPGGKVRLEFASGVIVTGDFNGRFETIAGRSMMLSLQNAKAELNGRVLFDPSWGNFDLALGSKVTSVYGGPADRKAYGEVDDFVATRVQETKYSAKDLDRHQAYAAVRKLRESNAMTAELKSIFEKHNREWPEDWLLNLEIYELLVRHGGNGGGLTKADVKSTLDQAAAKLADKADVIREGIALAEASSDAAMI